jgi:hypothetical protein
VGSLSRKRYTQYVEQNRKGDPWVGSVRGPSGNRLAARGGVESGGALHGIDGGDLAAGGLLPLLANGKLLTGNIGSLCEQQPLKALRASSAPGGPILQYKMSYHVIMLY